VRGVTVGGNLFELLKAVDKVGSDLVWFQSQGSPTVSVSHVKIGGSPSNSSSGGRSRGGGGPTD
jgi:predicted Zn-dependent protease